MFKGRRISGVMDLKTTFNNGDVIRTSDNFDDILAGLTMQPSEAYDSNFAEDVSIWILINTSGFSAMGVNLFCAHFYVDKFL